MILSFKTKNNGHRTNFPEKILLSGIKSLNKENSLQTFFLEKNYELKVIQMKHFKPKIHTIREDTKNRWDIGIKIHFAINSRTNNYLQFAEGSVKNIQHIKIFWNKNTKKPNVFIDNRLLPKSEIIELAINDGFDNVECFLDWFKNDFEGKIIHWTNKKY